MFDQLDLFHLIVQKTIYHPFVLDTLVSFCLDALAFLGNNIKVGLISVENVLFWLFTAQEEMTFSFVLSCHKLFKCVIWHELVLL
jgi:hypothetical protein